MSFLLLFLAAWFPADDAELVTKVGETGYTRADFGAWLLERYGRGHIHEYTREMTTLQAARTDGMLPTPEAVEAAFVAERERLVDEFHRGDEARFELELESRGYTPESWRAARHQVLTIDLILDAYARVARQPDQASLAKRYKDVYGAHGEAVVLDVAFFSAYAGVDLEAGRPDLQALRDAALNRARQARESLEPGASVRDLPDTDPVSSEFVVEGRIPQYRRNLLGPEIEKAVNSLDRPGDVSPPVVAFDGCYLVQLVSREPTTFEEARPVLEELMRQAEVTADERALVLEGLMERFASEITLR